MIALLGSGNWLLVQRQVLLEVMKNVSISLIIIANNLVQFYLIAIQDLKILDNGLLLSCAYDGKIICWHYNEDVKFGEIIKENQ